MKLPALFLALFIAFAASAQKKPLPVNCPDMKAKLQLIKQSFSNLQKFKKDLLPGSTYEYATSITICDVMGELQIHDQGSELIFKFKEEMFTDEDGKQITALVANFRKLVKAIFGDTYKEESGNEEGGAYYEYSPYTSYYPNIRIDFPFYDDFLRLSFEYEK